MSKSIQLTKESGIARLTIDRPAVKNAITFDMAVELASQLTALGRDAETRVVVDVLHEESVGLQPKLGNHGVFPVDAGLAGPSAEVDAN